MVRCYDGALFPKEIQCYHGNFSNGTNSTNSSAEQLGSPWKWTFVGNISMVVLALLMCCWWLINRKFDSDDAQEDILQDVAMSENRMAIQLALHNSMHGMEDERDAIVGGPLAAFQRAQAEGMAMINGNQTTVDEDLYYSLGTPR